MLAPRRASPLWTLEATRAGITLHRVNERIAALRRYMEQGKTAKAKRPAARDLVLGIVDSSSHKTQVSTETDQLHTRVSAPSVSGNRMPSINLVGRSTDGPLVEALTTPHPRGAARLRLRAPAS